MKPILSSLFLIVTLLSCGVLGPSTRSGLPSDANQPASKSNPTTVLDAGERNVQSDFAEERSLTRSSSLSVEGIASWYGSDFHGKATASGETYNMNDLTAAHRSLPFNTRVRVTNQINRRSVDVRINDRGPYIKDRVIDLSKAAAEKIDMIGIGTAPVLVEVIAEGGLPVTQENISSKEVFTVQLGSFSQKRDAIARASEIRGSRVVEIEIEGATFYRVYFKTYRSRMQAEEALQRLERSGWEGFVKQVDL